MRSLTHDRSISDVESIEIGLFSSPYWYEGMLQIPFREYEIEFWTGSGYVFVGTPQVTLSEAIAEPIYLTIGTAVPSAWISEGDLAIHVDPPQVGASKAATVEFEDGGATSRGTAAAREIRRLTELSVDQLAALFPDRSATATGRMSRENFHRWLSGRTAPTDANLERLLALEQLLREAAARVDDVQRWLLTPSEALDFDAPYGALRRGALTRLWPLIAALPSQRARTVVTDSEGDRGVLMHGSLRGSDEATPAEEVDDVTNWDEG